MRAGFICAGLVLASCGDVGPTIAPGSVVSNSVCADSYLLALPDIESRIGALSWQSRSALSRAPDAMQRLPQLDSNRERLAGLADVTLIGEPGTGRGDVALVWGEDFETVWLNLDTLSKTLNASNPTQALQSRLTALPRPDTPPRVLYLNRAGSSAGAGTFVDAVIRAAGGHNVVTHPGWHTPNVEAVLALTPDVVVTSFLDSDYHGANDALLRHSALNRAISHQPKIDIPGALWPCAGPGLVEATELLNTQLLKL